MDLALRDVSLTLKGRAVLRGVTATVRTGSLTCLLGTNGAGKTMLLRVLTGELRATSGRILLGDIDISRRPQREAARHFALVPQGVGDPPHMTVGELAALGRFRPGTRPWRRTDDEDRRIVRESLRRCGVEHLVDRPVAQLSGGEKQRSWLAFSLSQRKEFLLLDEALDALDFRARRELFGLIRDVAADGAGAVVTTHDIGLAAEFADGIIVIDGGAVAYAGPPPEDVRGIMGDAPAQKR